MNSSLNEDLYGETAVGLGYLTQAQLEEVLEIKQKIQELGITEPLGELLVKKGYLTVQNDANVLKKMGLSAGLIPGYRFLGKIGQGGMGTVYKAIQTSVNRTVAVKILAPAATSRSSYIARFFQEAQAAGRLHHKNLIAAIDVGSSNGLYYFVMEFVVGKSCRELVMTKGPLSEKQALDVAIQMADVLDCIDQNRMIHRDIKPENILLAEEGLVKLCDFGLAKSTLEPDQSLTQEGLVVGTPFFMSPEQIRGDKDIDIRADLYSLGATLYFLVSGKHPFEGTSSAETMSLHLRQPAPDPHRLGFKVGEDFSRVIRKLMAKDPGDRYPSPSELRKDLVLIKVGAPLRQASPHATRLLPHHKSRRASGSPSGEGISWPVAGAAVGGVLGVILLLMVSLSIASKSPSEPPSAPPASPPALQGMRPTPVPDLARGVDSDPSPSAIARRSPTIHPGESGGQDSGAGRSARTGGTPGEESRRDLRGVDGKLREELLALDEQAKSFLSHERFKDALEVWGGVRQKYELPWWLESVAGKIEEIGRMGAERFAAIRDQLSEAQKSKDPARVSKLRDRLVGWGLDSYLHEFDALIPVAEPPITPGGPLAPTEVQGPIPSESRWKKAMALALARDYAKAAEVLAPNVPSPEATFSATELESDRQNLLLASRVAAEAAAALSKLPKGHKLRLAYWDAHARPTEVEGLVAAADGGRVELLREEASLVIPIGEILPRSLAEIYSAPGTSSPNERKAVTVFCLIEGEPELARILQGAREPTLPPKYWEWARAVAESPSRDDPEELEVRKIFGEAERLFFRPASTALAVEKYKSLLDRFETSAFVRRNQAALRVRLTGAKEYLLGSGDLSAGGSFKSARAIAKLECLTSQKDADPAIMKDNYVQAEFSVVPEVEYKCWVYVGGCCQEVMTFAVQGDEVTTPNPKNPKDLLEAVPGTAVGAPVKLPFSSLRKKHSDHMGPKQPDRWEWVAVPLPRYSTPGTKSLRFISDQKGFSMAYVLITALRPLPPKEPELKNWFKARADIPGYSAFRLNAGGPSGQILREVWRGIGGIWVKDLTSHPKYPDGPTETQMLGVFEAPEEGVPDYGTRIRGFVYPPASGNYTFWIACDDTGELWLSTDDDPQNKVLIASAPEYCLYHEWEKHASQRSLPIALKGGHRYYIEALHKQAGGGSHVEVGWQLPDGTRERPIPGSYLSPVPKR